MLKPIFDVFPLELENKIGIEAEFTGNMPVHRLRQTADYLYKNNALFLDENVGNYCFGDGGKYFGISAVNQAVIEIVNNMYPSLHFKRPQPDATVGLSSSIELAFNPASLSSLIQNSKAYNQMFTLLGDLGYYTNEDCGLHLWYDYSLFGDNIDEMKATIEKFYIFLIKNMFFMNKVTNRPTYSSSFNSDMYALIGDPFGINLEKSLAEFVKQKKSFIRTFSLDEPKSLFNIIWGKGNVPAVEFRHCASSISWDETLLKATTIYKIIEFCRNNDEERLINFAFTDLLENEIKVVKDSKIKKLNKTIIETYA